MKKTIYFVSNSLLILLASSFLSCGPQKGQIMGRPPGIVTSEQENERNGEKTEKKEELSIDDEDDDPLLWDESQDASTLDKVNYDPIFEIEGWPYQEEGSTFRILAKQNIQVALYETPNLNDKTNKIVSFSSEENIGWVSSLVAVLSPSNYSAKHAIKVEGFRFSEGYLDDDQDAFSKTLKKGQSVQLLLYAGDSLCYLKVKGVVIQSLCPSSERYQGSFKGRDLREQMQPRSRMWWVQLGGEKGWIILDNNYIIEIR